MYGVSLFCCVSLLCMTYCTRQIVNSTCRPHTGKWNKILQWKVQYHVDSKKTELAFEIEFSRCNMPHSSHCQYIDWHWLYVHASAQVHFFYFSVPQLVSLLIQFILWVYVEARMHASRTHDKSIDIATYILTIWIEFNFPRPNPASMANMNNTLGWFEILIFWVSWGTRKSYFLMSKTLQPIFERSRVKRRFVAKAKYVIFGIFFD